MNEEPRIIYLRERNFIVVFFLSLSFSFSIFQLQSGVNCSGKQSSSARRRGGTSSYVGEVHRIMQMYTPACVALQSPTNGHHLEYLLEFYSGKYFINWSPICEVGMKYSSFFHKFFKTFKNTKKLFWKNLW